MMLTKFKLFIFILFCALQPNLGEDPNYKLIEIGTKGNLDYRIYFTHKKAVISPVHDIPLYKDKNKGIVNMIVEIPRWTNAKMEMNMAEPLNPIMQDVKNNQPRYVNNIFPFHGYPWNYGALPQTWEKPEADGNGLKGDNDPIDVIEIGDKVHKTGDIVPVKILGALGLKDSGEMDWKVIVIDITDPLANGLEDVSDLSSMPGLVEESFKWFKYYKFPGSGKTNEFLSDKPEDRTTTLQVIEENHAHWKELLKKGNIHNRKCQHTIENQSDNGKLCLMKSNDANILVAEKLFTDSIEKPDSVSASASTPTDAKVDYIDYAKELIERSP